MFYDQTAQIHSLQLHQHTISHIRRLKDHQKGISCQGKQLQWGVLQQVESRVDFTNLFVRPRVVHGGVDLAFLGGFGSFAEEVELLIGDDELAKAFEDGSNESGRDVQSNVVIGGNVVQRAVVLGFLLKKIKFRDRWA